MSRLIVIGVFLEDSMICLKSLEDGVVMAGVHALLALVPHPAVIGVGVVADGGVPDAEEVAALGVEAGLVA